MSRDICLGGMTSSVRFTLVILQRQGDLLSMRDRIGSASDYLFIWRW